MATSDEIDTQVGRLRAVFGGAGAWPQERVDEWRMALRDMSSLELLQAVTAWIRDRGELPRGPGAIRQLCLASRQIPGTNSEVRTADGERTYRCWHCLDTGTVSAIAEREGVRQAILIPCLRCPSGTSMSAHARVLPCRIVHRYETLHGWLEDPEDILGYRPEAI